MTLRKRKWRNHLYRLRRIRGLQQKQLAQLLGYRGTSTISRLEAGSVLPPVKVALLIELALGARLQEIYVDLTGDLACLLLRRARRLPPQLVGPIEGRIAGKAAHE